MSELWEQEPLGFMQIFVVTDKDDANVNRFLVYEKFEDIILKRRQALFNECSSSSFLMSDKPIKYS